MNKRWGFFVLAVILLAAGYKSRSFGESDKLQVGMVWLSDNHSGYPLLAILAAFAAGGWQEPLRD